MARLNWQPPPQHFRCEGVRLTYEADGDMARLVISSPDLGEVSVTVVGENKSRFERQVRGEVRPLPDRLGHLAHRYVEAS